MERERERERERPIENYGKKEQKEWLDNILPLPSSEQGGRAQHWHNLLVAILLLSRALLFFLSNPSGIGKIHDNSPRGLEKISSIWRFHPCVITMMRPNSDLSSVRMFPLSLVSRLLASS